MENFSGNFSGGNFKKISTEEASTENSNKIEFHNDNEKDNEEISYIMKQMEKLRERNIESFNMVILTNKKILDMIENNEIKGREDIKKLDTLFKEVESLDIDYLFWSSHKCIKIATIKYKNIDVLHYYIIKKGYKLRNRNIYHNFINEYIISLKDIDFINCEQGQIIKYVTILQMLLKYGDCDVNDNFFDPVKNTPLHYAIAFKQLQFVIVLIKFKYTNLSKINANGDTPLDFAVENLYNGKDVQLNQEFCKLLITFGAKTNSMNRQFKEIFQNFDNNENNEIDTTKNKSQSENNVEEKINILGQAKKNESKNVNKEQDNKNDNKDDNNKDSKKEEKEGFSCMKTFSF